MVRSDTHGGEFAITDDGKTLTIAAGENVVLKYNIAAVPSPEKDKPYYARSGHIHPVFTPQGHAVTGDMCADHVHQHAIWFAWTNAIYDGRKVDFWNSPAEQGRIEHAELLDKEWAADSATFRVRLKHIDLTGDEPRAVLSEIWNVHVEAKGDVYIIDLESTQTCTTDKPLNIKKYHYGAMGLRSPMAWNDPAGGFLTSEGKSRNSGNHTRPNWVDSFGPVGDGEAKENAEAKATAGVTVMQHPSNFRYPQPVRLHPKLSYFCFAPMVLGDFAIQPGEEYVSRFRYVVHDGELNEALTEKLWEDFKRRYPPKMDAGATVTIRVNADGSLAINSAAVTKDQLTARLKAMLAELAKSDIESKDVELHISVHPQVQLGQVIEIQTIAQKAGAESALNISAIKFKTEGDE